MEALARKRIEVVPSEQKWLRTPLEPGRGCIYVGVCRVNNKMYVGQHADETNCKRNRSCWNARVKRKKYEVKCPAIRNAVLKHGEDAFEWFILCECDEYFLDSSEKWFMKWCDCVSPNGYNIREGGSRGRLHPDSIAKMKASLPFERRSAVSKEVANRPEVKAALSKRMKGKQPARPSPQNEALRRAKISKTLREKGHCKGRPVSAQTREKIREKLVGRKLSRATCDKIAASMKGKKQSAEGIRKWTETLNAKRLARWATLSPAELHRAKFFYKKNRKKREQNARKLLLRIEQESV